MLLADFPRVRLAHVPTPLEAMPNLSRQLGGPALLVKRDDCTGLALGGNKARQLEFYLGEAIAQGADTVITTGAVQSNHSRMTAAAARKLGLGCEIQIEDRVAERGLAYRASGNMLLYRVFGARLHPFAEGENERGADANLELIAGRVRAAGGRPYVIPLGPEHPPIGALGYVDCAQELLKQARETGIEIDTVVVASGSASTHSGLLAGLRALESPARVCGICIRRRGNAQAERVLMRARMVADLLGRPGLVRADDVWVEDGFLGPGYGQPTAEMREATALAARLEGLLVDPVYTGKALAGLIGLVRRGAFTAGANVVFLHTGGTPALFGYPELFAEGGEGTGSPGAAIA
ncbi:MAG: D-cysteine desulfhydrase [Proteobacteria bacterium]|nr:D-cysteine desulfhydrase [Pseudomonadota bacterium]